MDDDRSSLPAAPKASKPSLPAHLASQDERIQHRVWIGGAVKTLLTMYGDWPVDPRIEAEWGRAWADDLEGFPQAVIDEALKAWRRSESKRPTPAAIIKLCRERMPRPRLVEPPRPPRPPRVTPERAAEMLREAGLDEAIPVRRFGPIGGGE